MLIPPHGRRRSKNGYLMIGVVKVFWRFRVSLPNMVSHFLFIRVDVKTCRFPIFLTPLLLSLFVFSVSS